MSAWHHVSLIRGTAYLRHQGAMSHRVETSAATHGVRLVTGAARAAVMVRSYRAPRVETGHPSALAAPLHCVSGQLVGIHPQTVTPWAALTVVLHVASLTSAAYYDECLMRLTR